MNKIIKKRLEERKRNIERISFALDKELLVKIDKYQKKHKIKNRSFMISVILENFINEEEEAYKNDK